MSALKTTLIHGGEPRPRIEGSVTLPIFQSSTYQQMGDDGYHDTRYLRLSNSPNHLVLHTKLALIEQAEAALVTASGMAAITTTLLSLLNAGDHLLAQDGLYGGTHTFLANELPNWGIEVSFVDLNDPVSWPQQVRPESRVFYVETMTNPLLEVGDLEAVVNFAGENNLTTVIDNTLAAGVNFNPVSHGFDLVVHSATKFLNGHSDLVAGAVIGSASLIEGIKHKLDHLGGSLDPHACFLLHRGIKTLALRMAQQNASTLTLAQALEAHPRVSAVFYAGLASHSHAERAQSLFSGFGGLLSFDIDGQAATSQRLIEYLELAVHAPSLGGVETLVTLPAQSSHAGLSSDERQRIGISDGLVRVAVGLEDSADLVADFCRALDKL